MTQTDPEARRWLPYFEPGQIVTAGALNQLAAALDETGRFHSRQFHGTGIGSGLCGHLKGGDLTFDPGWALDHHGRLIVVPKTRHIDVGAPVHVAAKHPSVRREEGLAEGFQSLTPVLSYRGDRLADLSGGSPRREASYRIDLVPGHVSIPEPASYALQPFPPFRALRAPKDTQRRFDDLKDGVLECMLPSNDEKIPGEGFLAPVRSLLKDLRLSQSIADGRPEATDVLAIAALNDMVYTLWQRDRAKQYLRLHGADVDELWPETADGVEHGIPLGWLYRASPDEGWVWDGRFRAGFALGLSRLELLGYAPRAIRQMCAQRVGVMLRSLKGLRPFRRGDGPKAEYDVPGPHAWTMTPKACEAGTQAWLQQLRFDRPQRMAAFWPLDPLRGDRHGPAASLPSVRDSKVDPRRLESVSESRTLAPSVLDPVNDPFTFCEYSNRATLDPNGTGLLGLAEMMGFPVAAVWTILLRQRSSEGKSMLLERRPVSILDKEACSGLEFVVLASFSEPLTLVTDGNDSPRVIGFARRKEKAAFIDGPQLRGQSFISWLFSR